LRSARGGEGLAGGAAADRQVRPDSAPLGATTRMQPSKAAPVRGSAGRRQAIADQHEGCRRACAAGGATRAPAAFSHAIAPARQSTAMNPNCGDATNRENRRRAPGRGR